MAKKKSVKDIQIKKVIFALQDDFVNRQFRYAKVLIIWKQIKKPGVG